MTQHREITPAPERLAAIAFHEAGHAVATALAYREVRMPPSARPRVAYATITREDDGELNGSFLASNVYHPKYVVQAPDWRWGYAMEWQIIIYMAGGVAEALHRCERDKQGTRWGTALLYCGTESDFKDATAVLADLHQLTDHRYALPRFTQRDGHPHEAVETEAISQRVLTDILRARLDELLPEPLDRVQERERRQRRQRPTRSWRRCRGTSNWFCCWSRPCPKPKRRTPLKGWASLPWRPS